ncbi:hypothetical protein AOQ84DRAFT_94851 [Glonium stellatum]|uniref:Uncharacterized protein n=1 Tax=Glonium stellatum TaxID=574774 RepID=A0A8E2EVK2_9PEZI|nr:hypothetical protein AOQ84DRAFT_94851 [Glonium stellatum]
MNAASRHTYLSHAPPPSAPYPLPSFHPVTISSYPVAPSQNSFSMDHGPLRPYSYHPATQSQQIHNGPGQLALRTNPMQSASTATASPVILPGRQRGTEMPKECK